MEATEILKHEHRAIESVLDSLDKAAEAVRDGRPVPAWVFADGLDFIRNFADRCHHGKEEDRLYPLMGERGLPIEGGPIGVMLMEHEQGRAFVREAAAKYANWTGGDAASAEAMADALQSYVKLLREHIYKEDNILYLMGNQVMSAEDDQRLVREFEDFEEKQMEPGAHEKYHAMIEKIEEETAEL
ncbi:MAG: hemerythrin domain-containing protein [Armatimonadota bacterium]|nr:hemerythrin domain-containing protein [Armatimonadota bacterium]